MPRCPTRRGASGAVARAMRDEVAARCCARSAACDDGALPSSSSLEPPVAPSSARPKLEAIEYLVVLTMDAFRGRRAHECRLPSAMNGRHDARHEPRVALAHDWSRAERCKATGTAVLR